MRSRTPVNARVLPPLPNTVSPDASYRFAWYIHNHGPEVNLFADHSQIVQLECRRSDIWGTTGIWSRALTDSGKQETAMQPRSDYARTAPGVAKAMLGLEEYVHHAGLEPGLLELVRLRASLINGCAYCVDMHTKVARSLGETEQRLYSVSVWREAPYYTERERAALAWTEAVTLVSGDHVPDEVYETARQHFPDKELIDLTLAIVAING